MATIDRTKTTLSVAAGDDPIPIVVPLFGINFVIPGDKTVVAPEQFTPPTGPALDGFRFHSPTIDADASVQLKGTSGESVAGWTFGFVQLKYIGTNHSRYRGATVRDGSV